MRSYRPRHADRGASAATLIIVLAIALVVIAGGGLVASMMKQQQVVQERDQALAALAETKQASPAPPGQPEAREPERPAAVTPQPASEPWRFEPARLDLGLLPPLELADVEFTIRNVTSDPLRIIAVKPTCACTTMLTDLEGTSIEPGGSVVAKATMEGRTSGGERNTDIQVFFDPGGRANIHISAEYGRIVKAEPGFIRSHEQRAGTVRVDAVDGRPFNVLSVNGDPPVFVQYDPASGEPRTSYELVWDLTRFDEATCLDAEGNRFPHSLAIETDHPSAPIVDVLLRDSCNIAERDPERTWRPGHMSINLGVIPPGGTKEFIMPLMWMPDMPRTATIHSVMAEDESIKAELLDVRREGDEVTTKIRITAPADHRGLIMTPIWMFSAEHNANFMLITSVRDDAASGTAARE